VKGSPQAIVSAAGGAIAGIYEADQPGHGLNNQLVRKLRDAPDAWVWESAGEALRASA